MSQSTSAPDLRKRWKRWLSVGAAVVVALLTGLALWGAAYRPNLEIPADRIGKHVAVEGNPLRVLQKGSGPDLLLIHGCPGSIEDWNLVTDELARDFRVTAYDRPGHGYSGWEGDRYSYDYQAGVALSLIDALQLKDVVVVGHSYGGTTALAIALRKPEQVKAIVVLDSSVYESAERPSMLYRTLAVPGLGTGFARLIGPLVVPGKIREGILAQFPAGNVPEGFVETRTEIWNQPKVTMSIARESIHAKAETAAMSSRYRQIEMPTFIAGQADNPVRRAEAERLARDIPGAELLLLSDTGHYLQIQKAPEVIDLIRKAGK